MRIYTEAVLSMNYKFNYEMFLNMYVNGKKYHQNEAFNDIDVLYDGPSSNVYIKKSVLHQKEFIGYFKNRSRSTFIVDNFPMNIDQFVSKYDEFLGNYKQKDREGRYAVQLLVLLPKSVNTSKLKRHFVKEFVKGVNELGLKKSQYTDDPYVKKHEKVLLPYTAEVIEKRKESYVLFTIIERYYLGHMKYKLYRKDIVLDKRTGKFPKRGVPEEHLIVKHKKGDYQLDKEGKKIPNECMFSKNMRTFSYPKSTTGRNLFPEFMEKLKTKVINAMQRILTKGVKTGKILYKRQNKPTYANVIRRRIGMINYAKEVVQYTINFLLQHEQTYDKVIDHFNPGKDAIVRHTKAYHELIHIFEKYRSRFKKQEFHDTEGRLRLMRYCYQKVDELEDNIRVLIKMFFHEVNQISLTEI